MTDPTSIEQSDTVQQLTPDEAKRIRIALIFGDPALESQPDPKLEVAKAKIKAIEQASL